MVLPCKLTKYLLIWLLSLVVNQKLSGLDQADSATTRHRRCISDLKVGSPFLGWICTSTIVQWLHVDMCRQDLKTVSGTRPGTQKTSPDTQLTNADTQMPIEFQTDTKDKSRHTNVNSRHSKDKSRHQIDKSRHPTNKSKYPMCPTDTD